MAKVGDKFVIEIDEVFMGFKNELYKVKGFNSLVFDDNGIGKLTPYRDSTVVNNKILEEANSKGYAEGFKAGANAQLKAFESVISGLVDINKDKDFLNSIYGGLSVWEVLDRYDLKEVLKLHKKYKQVGVKNKPKQEAKEHVLCVGDIVEVPGCKKAIITMIANNRCHVVGKNFKGDLDLFLVKFLGEHKDLFDE